MTLTLNAYNPQTFHPSVVPILSHIPHKLGPTYASALSRLSLKTLVTLRIISKLSIARHRIRCAVCVAAPAVGCVPLPAVGRM